MISFTFNSIARENYEEIAKAIKVLCEDSFPIIICVGSDLVIGDSLGPIVGSKINYTLNGRAYVYGTLDNTITAREIETINREIKKLHPLSKIIVIDSAVGNREDVGQVKVLDHGINPGLGANKTLPNIGDVSIIGVVAEKNGNSKTLHGVRLSLINTLSKDIINGLNLAFIKN